LIRTLRIVDERGERVLARDALPLSIGTGAAAGIELPGPAYEEIVAYLDCADQHPFVQCAGARLAVAHNGRRMEGSEWLSDGDRLRFGETVELLCTLEDEQLSLSVEACAPRLRPPSVPPPATRAAPPAPLASPSIEMPPPVGRPARRGGLIWTLSVAFVALALGVAFVFLATPFAVRVTPLPDALTVRGALPALKLGGRYLLAPGSYRVAARKAGYRPLERRIEVRYAEPLEVALELVKLPGRVTIASLPVAGAAVRIDGRMAGRTPLDGLALEAGSHKVEVKAPRYLVARADLEVEGLGKKQRLEIRLTPAWAALSFSSEPPGATLSIDGDVVGVTPLSIDLAAGEHALELAKANYDTLRDRITVVANQPRTVPRFTLRESAAEIALSSRPSGATVTVDGVFQGRTPLALQLTPRATHALRLTLPGFRPVRRTLRVKAAQRTTLRVPLAPETGVVFVTGKPPGAQLYVDGKRAGKAPRRLELSTVAHRLELRSPGYAPRQVSVTPRAGISQELNLILVTKAEATPRVIHTADGQALRLIRGGRLRMGASRREAGRRANENLRRIELTRPFYLGVKEVSNADFRRFAPGHASGSFQGMSLDAPAQPVVAVSWDQTARYLNWLSAKDGLQPSYREQDGRMVVVRPLGIGYRLPTEAEWVWAARYPQGAKMRLEYPWGGPYPPRGKAGNYADAAAATLLSVTLGDYNDGFPVSAPVGRFTPNALGIFDLGGNVAEWCLDYYTVYPGAAQRLSREPLGPKDGKHHVVRGSSWRQASISALRLSYRDYSSKARDDLGFRIARYVE